MGYAQYYCYHNGNQLGPISMDELRNLNIRRDTMVWRDGLQDWVAAGSLPELSGIFAYSAPLSLQTHRKTFAKTAKVFAIFGIIASSIMNLVVLLMTTEKDYYWDYYYDWRYYGVDYEWNFFYLLLALWLLAFSIIVLVKASITLNRNRN